MPNTKLKEDPVWSILPSYDMLHATFNAQVSPPDYHEEEYTLSSPSGSSSPTALPSPETAVLTDQVTEDFLQGSPDNDSDPSSPSSVVGADRSSTSWRETILDNIHNLQNISDPKSSVSRDIEVSVHFTEDVVQLGVAPKVIDPSQFEYKQGDYLHGYVLLRNNSGQPIPFEMFYVLFEGRFMVKNITSEGNTILRKELVRTFLEMYDFAACWTPLRISRLLNEKKKQCEFHSIMDPRDNSEFFFSDKSMRPGILYKRPFTFKIPENLLDTQCKVNHLPSHTRLPPSLGMSDEERASWTHDHQPVTDFAFNDSSVAYRVVARFVGKASKLGVLDSPDSKSKITDSQGDEFIILKEASTYLRLILERDADTESERIIYNETARVLYDNLVGRIQEKIRQGRALQEAKKLGEKAYSEYVANCDEYSHPETSHEYSHPETSHESYKNRQLYTRSESGSEKSLVEIHKNKHYEVAFPVFKQGFIRPTKFKGLFVVRSPRTEYVLNYLQPEFFEGDTSGREDSRQLNIPLELFFQPAENTNDKAPQVTLIKTELVVLTIQKERYPFPVEITHDFLFRNKSVKLESEPTDTFSRNIQAPMRLYKKELLQLEEDVGGQHFKVEASLWNDVQALADASIKENRLNLRESRLIEEDGTDHDNEKSIRIALDKDVAGSYSKKLVVSCNALKAEKKSLRKGPLPPGYMSNSDLCLVPSFQTCSLIRIYYLRLIVRLSTADRIEFKLPVTVRR